MKLNKKEFVEQHCDKMSVAELADLYRCSEFSIVRIIKAYKALDITVKMVVESMKLMTLKKFCEIHNIEPRRVRNFIAENNIDGFWEGEKIAIMAKKERASNIPKVEDDYYTRMPMFAPAYDLERYTT